MKHIIIALFLCVNLIQCNAQDNNNHKKSTAKIMNRYQYLITKDFEKFDYTTYYPGPTKLSFNEYEEDLPNNNLIKIISAISGSVKREYINNSIYLILKSFHDGGNIRKKNIYFNQGTFPVGIGYEFDKEGKFIKEIDYDKGYDFSLEEVIAFCEKKGHPVEKGYKRRYETVIRKDSVGDRKFWIIEYHDGIKPLEIDRQMGDRRAIVPVYEQIVLEGTTGKVLSEKTIGLDENSEHDSYKEKLKLKRSTALLTLPDEKENYQETKFGIAYTSTHDLPKDVYQIYEGRAYNKAEWKEFEKSLPWWQRML